MPHGVTKLLALLGRHLFPAFEHTVAPVHAMAVAAAEAAEQEFAQEEQTHGLPVADLVQAKQGRHEPVPQPHDDKAQENGECQCDHREFQYPNKPIWSHKFTFMCS